MHWNILYDQNNSVHHSECNISNLKFPIKETKCFSKFSSCIFYYKHLWNIKWDKLFWKASLYSVRSFPHNLPPFKWDIWSNYGHWKFGLDLVIWKILHSFPNHATFQLGWTMETWRIGQLLVHWILAKMVKCHFAVRLVPITA